jgi:hypothetical protein
MVQDDILLFAALYKHKGGKHAGGGILTHRGQGHEWSIGAQFAGASGVGQRL